MSLKQLKSAFDAKRLLSICVWLLVCCFSKEF